MADGSESRTRPVIGRFWLSMPSFLPPDCHDRSGARGATDAQLLRHLRAAPDRNRRRCSCCDSDLDGCTIVA